MTLLAWLVRRHHARATPKREGGGDSPVEGFDEEVDRAATGEPDGEGLDVGVAESDDAPLTFTREHLERSGDHRAFDTPAGDRACDLAVIAHRHGGAGITR